MFTAVEFQPGGSDLTLVKNFTENYMQFVNVLSKTCSSPVLGREKFKELQFGAAPGVPLCLGQPYMCT